MLYYNVAYADGSARPVRDTVFKGTVAPFAEEFWTRAPGPAQQTGLGKYTSLKPYNNPAIPGTATASDRQKRQQELLTTNHIERGWSYFDLR